MESTSLPGVMSPSSPSPAPSPFDPHAAFIAQDGLEYANLADYICARPLDCWRNSTILRARQEGRSEEAIRQWIKGYDGDDPTPSSQLHYEERAERQARANYRLFDL